MNDPYLAIQVIMMPRDTNPHGTIFGGLILSYIDQAGAIGARREVIRAGGKPANLRRGSPPGLQLQLEAAPEALQLGARVTLVSRRWGLRYRSVTEVIAFTPDSSYVEEQKEGAFRQWRHSHEFQATPDNGT